MAPIEITIINRGGEPNQDVIGDNDGFKAILDDLGARFLKDENRAKVRSFGGLVECSRYTATSLFLSRHLELHARRLR